MRVRALSGWERCSAVQNKESIAGSGESKQELITVAMSGQ